MKKLYLLSGMAAVTALIAGAATVQSSAFFLLIMSGSSTLAFPANATIAKNAGISDLTGIDFMAVILYKFFMMLVEVAENLGRMSFLFLEDAVEIGDVVESAVVAYFRDRCCGIHQKTGSVSEPYIDNIIGD